MASHCCRDCVRQGNFRDKARPGKALSRTSSHSLSVDHTASSSGAGGGVRASPPSGGSQPGVGNRTVFVYLLLALIAMAPGLVRLAGLEPERDSDLGLQVVTFWRTLGDLSWWSFRFWLGIVGVSMMALLLVYPLRKLFPNARFLGSVGGWFHLHILIGVAAPVLILYHCNFRFDGRITNASVALWSMLIVAASGIVGHFVYRRVSRGFYQEREEALRQVEQILAALKSHDPHGTMFKARAGLKDMLDAVETALLTPRRGIIAALSARRGLSGLRDDARKALDWIIENWGQEQRVDPLAVEQTQGRARAAIDGYFQVARRAASRSVREQLWARWRLFHLPVFLLMLVAIGMHVYWVIAADANKVTLGIKPVQTTSIAPPAAPTPAIAPAIKTVRAPAAQPKSDRKSQTLPSSDQIGAMLEQQAAPKPPEPKLVRPPAPAVVAKAPTTSSPTPQPAPELTERPQPQPIATPAPTLATPATPPPSPAVAELKRVTEAPMALGAPKRGLAEQIALWREKYKRKEFFHSLADAGFELTGKHLRLDCAKCHKAPLKETRSMSPRQCIDCHRKDDPHKARRPNCAQCHITDNWHKVK